MENTLTNLRYVMDDHRISKLPLKEEDCIDIINCIDILERLQNRGIIDQDGNVIWANIH